MRSLPLPFAAGGDLAGRGTGATAAWGSRQAKARHGTRHRCAQLAQWRFTWGCVASPPAARGAPQIAAPWRGGERRGGAGWGGVVLSAHAHGL